jgi:hypothetical protein
MVLLSAGCLASSGTESGGKITPACIADLCFDGELLTEKELVDRYGPGFAEEGKFPYHCYEVSSDGPYIRFRIYHGEPKNVLDAFLSEALSCPGASRPTLPLPDLRTRQGLRLGDPRSKVVKLYGEPEREGAANALEMLGASREPPGDTAMQYFADSPETLHATVFLRAGRVSALLISRFP